MSLAKEKLKQKGAIKNAHLEHLYSGCDTSFGITMDADDHAAANIIGAAFLAEKTGRSVTIRDFANDTHTLPPEDMTALAVEIALFRQEALEEKWRCDAAIDKASAEHLVTAITFDPA